MKKVIEANGKFFVKEYNENGDSVAISLPFDIEADALTTLEDVVEDEAPKRRGRKAKDEEETEE